MPREVRMDIFGLLYYVIVRGIERSEMVSAQKNWQKKYQNIMD